MNVKFIFEKLPFAIILVGSSVILGLAYRKHKLTKKIISDCSKVDYINNEEDNMLWLEDLDPDYKYEEFQIPKKPIKSFNPFSYVYSECDIRKFVKSLLYVSNGNNDINYTFIKTETFLLEALIAYIYFESPSEEKDLTTVVTILDFMKKVQNEDITKNNTDSLFEKLAEHSPEHYAVQQYNLYKLFTCDNDELKEYKIINSCKQRIKNLMFVDVVSICKKLNTNYKNEKCELLK